MKRLLIYIFTGIFFAGLAGIVQAAEYNAREDCCTEGPPYNRELMQGPVVPTIVMDVGHPYIEGMGFAPRPKGVKTVLPKFSDKRDWCCEDMSTAEMEMHFKKANEMEPAAGK